jgi:DNA-binding NarL/FixJ family response regulator
MTTPPATGLALRVVLADDTELFRAGLASLLERHGFEVTAQVGDGPALLAAVTATNPDLAVIDIRMPPTGRLEGLRAAVDIRAAHPRVGVLLLSQHVEVAYLTTLVGDDAHGVGYQLKERASTAGFVDSVRRIAAGECVLDPEVIALMVNGSRRRGHLTELTRREREVLASMAEGRSNSAIAEQFHVTVTTVENHVRSIFQRLRLPAVPEYHRRVLAVLAYLQQT